MRHGERNLERYCCSRSSSASVVKFYSTGDLTRNSTPGSWRRVVDDGVGIVMVMVTVVNVEVVEFGVVEGVGHGVGDFCHGTVLNNGPSRHRRREVVHQARSS